jgi:hypothetical protein
MRHITDVSKGEETVRCLRQLVAAKEPRGSAKEVTRMRRVLVAFTGGKKEPRAEVVDAFRADSSRRREENCRGGRSQEGNAWN